MDLPGSVVAGGQNGDVHLLGYGFEHLRANGAVENLLLLRRIGTEFVERFNRHRGGLDARRVLRSATSGQPLLFFPEGTFIDRPGLLKFHIGAFVSAAHAGCPVVPCIIRGSRDMLPSPLFFPRPGRIEVELLDPLHPPADVPPERAAAALRDTARAQILARVGEPDLADHRVIP
ncbi:MAG: 1-acyl-sn-glycerol-3-phosphate acyltransferase [Proteobacteria bacterium]|nr:1-acyl-sn-glycerol-3-phosphate acyltransferase [Pseudomonadota bacterium]